MFDLGNLDLVNAGGAVLRNNNIRVRPASVALKVSSKICARVLVNPLSVEWELAGGNTVYPYLRAAGPYDIFRLEEGVVARADL